VLVYYDYHWDVNSFEVHDDDDDDNDFPIVNGAIQ
jgi:hypothetical protein